MYIYIYIYMCTHTHTYMYIYIYICTHTHIYTTYGLIASVALSWVVSICDSLHPTHAECQLKVLRSNAKSTNLHDIDPDR